MEKVINIGIFGLFLIYVNNITAKQTPERYIQFADDTPVFFSSPDLQCALHVMVKELVLNENKTQQVMFWLMNRDDDVILLLTTTLII